jgi:hypothetical protein
MGFLTTAGGGPVEGSRSPSAAPNLKEVGANGILASSIPPPLQAAFRENPTRNGWTDGSRPPVWVVSGAYMAPLGYCTRRYIIAFIHSGLFRVVKLHHKYTVHSSHRVKSSFTTRSLIHIFIIIWYCKCTICRRKHAHLNNGHMFFHVLSQITLIFLCRQPFNKNEYSLSLSLNIVVSKFSKIFFKFFQLNKRTNFVIPNRYKLDSL